MRRSGARTTSSSRRRGWRRRCGPRTPTPRGGGGRRAHDDASGAEELLAEEEDAELRRVLGEARERIVQLEEEIRVAMVESDPNDEKDVIVEIQGGAGGEEAGLWAGDVYRMLVKYAHRRGFHTEP